MADLIRSVRGMNDFLPAQSALWRRIEGAAHACFARYGYGEIRTPILERTELFRRQLGEHTDLVEKEMYTFVDALNGESLTLRPEATVPTMRALLERGVAARGKKQRVYYVGPMFRHERPQQGRYRQFHQIGAEAAGYAGPLADVEQVLMCRRLWEELGIAGKLRLKVNNLGDAEERRSHREALVSYFRDRQDELDEGARRRIETNPLRLLDSKDAQVRAIAEDAPKLEEHLGEESRAIFAEFESGLARQSVACERSHTLVRGLDYYCYAVYEWVFDARGKELTLCGGGRYDGLAGQIGGHPLPGCGFAIGMERLAELVVRATEEEPEQGVAECEVFVVYGKACSGEALALAEALRSAGICAAMDTDPSSFKSMMRKADASGAPCAAILGEDEAAAKEVSVKPLRGQGEQFRIAQDKAAQKLKEMLDSGP